MKPSTVTPMHSTKTTGRMIFPASMLCLGSGHLELVKWNFAFFAPPKSATHAQKMFVQDAAIIRTVSHMHVAIGSSLITALAQIESGRDLEVDKSLAHGRDI